MIQTTENIVCGYVVPVCRIVPVKAAGVICASFGDAGKAGNDLNEDETIDL